MKTSKALIVIAVASLSGLRALAQFPTLESSLFPSTFPTSEAKHWGTSTMLSAGNLFSEEVLGYSAGIQTTSRASWVLPKIEGKNLHYQTFRSKAAGEDVSYLIYRPSEYETSKDKKYPVVYWLHGIGGSQAGVPRLVDRIDAAIESGKCPPMLVVFVNGMKDSFYCDAVDGKTPVESMIIKDLVPHIDASYRTIAKRDGRAVEGFSMGGFGAAHLGFKYPDMFGAVSIIDGALVDIGAMKTRHAELFKRIFGGKEEYFTREHPSSLSEKNAAAIRGKTVVRQAVGQLAAPNKSFHEQLTNLKIEHDYDPLEGVGHQMLLIYEKLGDKNWDWYRKAFGNVGRSNVKGEK